MHLRILEAWKTMGHPEEEKACRPPANNFMTSLELLTSRGDDLHSNFDNADLQTSTMTDGGQERGRGVRRQPEHRLILLSPRSISQAR